jgi:hypothetical protein
VVAEPERRPGTEPRNWSWLGWLAVALAVLSALGLLVLLVGALLDIEGAREGEEGPFIFTIAWLSFSLGGIAAAIAGAAAVAVGRMRGLPAVFRNGLIAVGYFVAALVLFLAAL